MTELTMKEMTVDELIDYLYLEKKRLKILADCGGDCEELEDIDRKVFEYRNRLNAEHERRENLDSETESSAGQQIDDSDCLHPLFSVVEDLNFDDGNYEFKYQKIAEIIECIYRLPIMKVLFLDEIVLSMTAETIDSEIGFSIGCFERNMTQVLNQVPGLSKFGKSMGE